MARENGRTLLVAGGLWLEIARLQNVDLRRAVDKTGTFFDVVFARMDLFGNCVKNCYKSNACLTS